MTQHINRALFVALLIVVIASAQLPSAAQKWDTSDCPHTLFYDDASGVFTQVKPWEMPYKGLTPAQWARVKWHRYRVPWARCTVFIATY